MKIQRLKGLPLTTSPEWPGILPLDPLGLRSQTRRYRGYCCLTVTPTFHGLGCYCRWWDNLWPFTAGVTPWHDLPRSLCSRYRSAAACLSWCNNKVRTLEVSWWGRRGRQHWRRYDYYTHGQWITSLVNDDVFVRALAQQIQQRQRSFTVSWLPSHHTGLGTVPAPGSSNVPLSAPFQRKLESPNSKSHRRTNHKEIKNSQNM